MMVDKYTVGDYDLDNYRQGTDDERPTKVVLESDYQKLEQEVGAWKSTTERLVKDNERATLQAQDYIAQLKASEDRAREFLDAEPCPYCENEGFNIIHGRDGEPEQEQCQWCYETENSFFNVKEMIRQALTQTEGGK